MSDDHSHAPGQPGIPPRWTSSAKSGVGTARNLVSRVWFTPNHGSGNTAWVGDYKGVPMLFAERDQMTLALACSAPWLARSVGFAGVSDGWQDLSQHFRMTWNYTRAENGNVAMTGEVGVQAAG